MNDIRGALRTRYQRESFFPTWLGLFINPFYFARKGLAAHVRDLAWFAFGRNVATISCLL